MHILLQCLGHAYDINFYEINQDLVLLDVLHITTSLLLSPSLKVFVINVHRVAVRRLNNYKLLHI